MIFRISFSDILHFTFNARKEPLIPEGFILETPPERKPLSHSTPPPTASQSPVSLFASPVSETASGSVIPIGNDSTDTLVNLVVAPVYLKPILILQPSAHEVRQTRRISFADSAVAPSPRTTTNVMGMGMGMGQVLCSSPMTAEETLEQGDDFKENIPKVEKESRRKSITRTMSLLAQYAYRNKTRRFSVPSTTSLTSREQTQHTGEQAIGSSMVR